MTVSIYNPNPAAGGVRLATLFSDPLNSQSFFSKNWIAPTIADFQVAPPGGMAWGNFSIVASKLSMGVGGPAGNTNTITTAAVPLPMQNNSKIFNAGQQFAQWTIGAFGVPANQSYFLSCYLAFTLNDGTGTGGHDYTITGLNFANGLSTAINRVNTGVAGFTTLLARGTLPIPAANDVWRMSLDSVTTPGTTIIKTTVNGVLVNTTNDNGAGHSTFGTPGIVLVNGSVTAGDVLSVSNFSCGLGL